jgi:twitching motility protein PilT
MQLCTVLKGVVSQRLVARADGKGMVPAVEILVSTARVRELIADPKRTREIHDAIAQGRETYGMISFDQSLTELVHKRFVTYQEALANASNPDDFALFFRGVSRGGAVSNDFEARPTPQPMTERPATGVAPAPTAVSAQPTGVASPTGVLNAPTGAASGDQFQIDRFK